MSRFDLGMCCGGLMLLLAGGCMSTTQTWKHAQATELRSSGLRGCLIDRTSNPPRVAALVAAYEVPDRAAPNLLGADQEFDLIIPLDQDGWPVWPFGFRGNSRDTREIWAQLSSEQRQALKDIRFTEKDFRAAQIAMKSEVYVSLNSKPEGIASHRGTQYGAGETTPGGQRIGLAWYWPATDQSVSTSQPMLGSPRRWPASSKVLVLPGSQPRPELDHNLNIVMAIPATPVAMVVDVFTFPFLLQWMIHGDNP